MSTQPEELMTHEQFTYRVVQWAKRLHPHNKGICVDSTYEYYLQYCRCKSERERNLKIAEAAQAAADDSRYWEGNF